MDGSVAEHALERGLTSLIFPTYNPGPLIERTWRELDRFLDATTELWQIIFVCDGCTDGTPERLAELIGRPNPSVQVLSYAPNRGKGYAVRAGLQAARGQWRLFTDVDLAYGFDDVRRLANALKAGADVAIGSRTHPNSQMLLPTRLQGYVYRRHLQSVAFSRLARWLLPVTQHDTQAGLKGMTAAAANQLLPHLSCNGFGLDCDLLTGSARFGLSVVEVPVCVRYEDVASTTSVASMGRMIRELWRIRRAWRSVPPTATADVTAPPRAA